MKSVPKSQIGHYKIISQIGAGGMGKVYLAEDTRLERKVTVKLLKEEYTKNADRMNRFVREAKTASSLNHPNIIVIHEIGEEDGTKFIAAEYIEGETLRERFLRNPLTLEEILGVAVQIGEALTAAHKAKIIHRDIKPENVMIRPDGYVKVLDFGLAKLAEHDEEKFGSEVPTQKFVKTNPGVVMGSAAYMSPEQARGLADIDARTDIFSLGIVLYEMLAGRLPFSGESLSEIIASVIYKDAESVALYYENCPPELERIVMKSLEKDREERYQGVKDLVLDLKSFKRRLEFETELGRKIPNKDKASGKETNKQSIPPTISMSSGSNKDAILLTEFENLTGDTVFDNTLKMALAVSLEQSPFLNIFADERVRQTLSLMGRSADERITREIGREICQRKGLKAFIAGTISNLGTTYVLTLEAVNAQTGEILGRQLEQAESKEQVLKALGQAASGLREKLGENLSSIEKFDAPIEDVTTSSLEALKFFSLGCELMMRGEHLKAIPFSLRAVEVDPNFVFAYADLAIEYSNTGHLKLAAEYATKAFALREKVSEVEKFRITYFYYVFVTGEIDKVIELLELRKLSNPNEDRVNGSLSFCYTRIGQFEKSIEAARECIRINPQNSTGYSNLASALLILNRFDEVKKAIKKAHQIKIDRNSFRLFLYYIAFLEGDTETMVQQLTHLTGQFNEYLALDLQTQTAAFCGQWRKAQKFSRQTIEFAIQNNLTGFAAVYSAEQALRIAFWRSGTGLPLANDSQLKLALKTQTQKALKFECNKESLVYSALALAIGGQTLEADKLLAELKNEYAKDTLLNGLWLPMIKAVLRLQNGKLDEAIEELESAGRFERAAEFYPQYLRGLAYLKLGKEKKAAAEFEKILNHRGEAALSAIYPLAQLGKARATKNKEEYEKFFELWKEADKDMPALVAARKEFEELT